MRGVTAEQEHMQAPSGESGSPFPDSPRVIYTKNPLVEVVCQLRFPPILRIDAELPSAFQERIRSEYPLLREKTEGELQLPSQVPSQFAELLRSSFALGKRRTGYDFVSSDGIWTVGLTREFLSLATTSYVRWEAFREQLALPFEALVAVYRPAFFTRVGLRYQDLIRRSRLGLDNHSWASLLKPHITGILGASDLQGPVSATFTQSAIRFQGDLGQVALRHGLVQTADNDETCYVIDGDFFTDQRIETGHVREKLDYFNHHAGRLFRWCIADALHDAMEPKPVL